MQFLYNNIRYSHTFSLGISLLFILFCTANAQIKFSLTENFPQDNILSIVENTVYNEIYICTSTRVFVSSDKGVSWNKIANPGSITVNTLYCTSTGKLYVGVGKTLTNPTVGILEYDRINNTWLPLQGSPLDITTILEEKDGNLFVGTGNYDNYLPLPINKGTGFYRFSAGLWNPVNSNFGYLPGNSVFPAIRQMIYTEQGTLLAATYGNGVWKMENNSWELYGKDIHNNFVNCIAQLKNGSIIIGTDDGIEIENNGAWNKINELNGETVRAISQSDSIILIGTGAYHWQTKPVQGTVYSSSDEGKTWIKNLSYPQTIGIHDIKKIGGNSYLLASTGLWIAENKGVEWNNVNINTGGNRTIQIIANNKGDLFALCTTTSQNKSGGGVFKSTDKGKTWACIVNGLKHQRGNFIFCDSKEKVWCGLTRYTNKASNSTHDDAVLYYSLDNGSTWLPDTNILRATNYYSCMAETTDGKLFVTNGWGGPSNVSSTTDHISWNNDLNMGEQNGGLAFNCAVNGNNIIYIGTETHGIQRSLNGEKGTFQSLGASSPKGNSKVYANPLTGEVVGVGGGSDPLKYFYGSKSEDNGENMFAFRNFPDYAAPSSVIFGSKGIMYLANQGSSFENTGLYTTVLPYSEFSTFEKIIANANVSYYFASMTTDECGYLYGCGIGSGVYVSDKPVHKPLPSNLKTPEHKSILSQSQSTFTWANTCTLLSHTLQIAEDSNFINIIYQSAGINGFGHEITNNTFLLDNNYFWRIISRDATNDTSTSDTHTFTYKAVTSISSQDDSCEYSSVIPNITSESIYISKQTSYTYYKIINILGETVLYGILRSDEDSEITLQNLRNGFYIIVLKAENTSEKFSFQKCL